jgi:hypothetical protein
MLTRRDVFKKLSDRCWNENAAVSAKIQTIVRNSNIHGWVGELPVIPDLLLSLLGCFENLDSLVSKGFVWEYWSKALVEENSAYPDVTEIAELAEIESHVHRFGVMGLQLPVDSIDELRVAYAECRRRRFHR